MKYSLHSLKRPVQNPLKTLLFFASKKKKKKPLKVFVGLLIIECGLYKGSVFRKCTDGTEDKVKIEFGLKQRWSKRRREAAR